MPSFIINITNKASFRMHSKLTSATRPTLPVPPAPSLALGPSPAPCAEQRPSLKPLFQSTAIGIQPGSSGLGPNFNLNQAMPLPKDAARDAGAGGRSQAETRRSGVGSGRRLRLPGTARWSPAFRGEPPSTLRGLLSAVGTGTPGEAWGQPALLLLQQQAMLINVPEPSCCGKPPLQAHPYESRSRTKHPKASSEGIGCGTMPAVPRCTA